MRIFLFSIHGLFRGEDLEIGRDADNGGQVIYVMELARELSKSPDVDHVHLFTRRIEDRELSPDYSETIEKLNDKLDIRRISCGGKKYLPKEKLWPHLDEFVSNTIQHIKSENIFPDWMHSHYADAGYVASEVSAYLHVPFVHTTHSLGKPKLKKLIHSGMARDEAYEKYNFGKRFEAEEMALANAEFIVTSTQKEISQFDDYENARLSEFHVIPPGIDFDRFYPYYEDSFDSSHKTEEEKQAMFMAKERMDKFLSEPSKPLILAICRPDKKKNIDGLIHAYGTDRELQSLANLAIYAGIRGDIASLPSGGKEVLTEILLLMDKYNLYGKLAIPKKHDTEWEVPEIYRLCARQKGVFVNIALTEPFGLTILEATGCGLPVLATDHGGPTEIIPKCKNGFLVSPDDTPAIQEHLKNLLTDEELWQECSNAGTRNVRKFYGWPVHAETYLKLIKQNREASSGIGRKNIEKSPTIQTRLKTAKRMIISDIDGTLISDTGNYVGLEDLKAYLATREDKFVFGVATGRSLSKVRAVLKEYEFPTPDVIISSVGAEIHYGLKSHHMDKGWPAHINYQWNRDLVEQKAVSIPGLELQEEMNQQQFKISFYIHPEKNFSLDSLYASLGSLAQRVNIMVSRDAYLDILPKRASKGRAIRFLSQKWSIPLQESVVCGDSGNDLDMYNGSLNGIVVGNHSKEMECLRESRRVFFAEAESSAGILEGLEHFKFNN